jgi:glucose-1-phosphate cytidylyltransferase
MQVVILCGGMGTRIRDVADDIPKPMIPIGEKPILWHIMRLYASAGFRRFILCLGYKGWLIKRYFLDYHLMHADLTVRLGAAPDVTLERSSHRDDWEVTLVETGLHTMTGGRLKKVEPYLDGEHFLLTYGDGLSDVDLNALVDFHVRHGRLGTLTAVRLPGRFGELEVQGPLVSTFSEKPVVSRGRINGGFFAFRREFVEALDDAPDLILEREPLVSLAQEGQLAAFVHDGFWHCMDNIRDYQYLNQLWAEQRPLWDRGCAGGRARAA